MERKRIRDNPTHIHKEWLFRQNHTKQLAETQVHFRTEKAYKKGEDSTCISKKFPSFQLLEEYCRKKLLETNACF